MLLVIWSIQLVIYLYLVAVLCVDAAGHLVDPTGHLLVSCSSSLRGCCWSSGQYNWSSTRTVAAAAGRGRWQKRNARSTGHGRSHNAGRAWPHQSALPAVDTPQYNTDSRCLILHRSHCCHRRLVVMVRLSLQAMVRLSRPVMVHLSLQAMVHLSLPAMVRPGRPVMVRPNQLGMVRPNRPVIVRPNRPIMVRPNPWDMGHLNLQATDNKCSCRQSNRNAKTILCKLIIIAVLLSGMAYGLGPLSGMAYSLGQLSGMAYSPGPLSGIAYGLGQLSGMAYGPGYRLA